MVGIVLIALEDYVKINKAAIAIGMSIIMWCVVLANLDEIAQFLPSSLHDLVASHNSLSSAEADKILIENLLIDKLGEVATTMFFVMATMVIVELVDSNGGFRFISEMISSRRKRKLLWIITILAFFISGVLDNIAAAIVIITLLRKLILDNNDRIIFACVTIIAANAGGAWSPIGDVTTILLWSKGNISALHQIGSLIIPSAVTLVLTVLLAQRFFEKTETFPKLNAELDSVSKKRKRYGLIIFSMGVLSLATVPVFTQVTGLPPYMGVMFGLTVLWVVTDTIYGRMPIAERKKMSVVKMFSRIDMATILFFYGVLMSVAAIDVAGILSIAGEAITDVIKQPMVISFIIGICSSFVDNVALVAATMGMYPTVDADSVGVLSQFAVDGHFWTFLAYCGVTGGSLLIIGSATGVTVMGMEKISFMYYLKKFSLLAFVGYLGGALTYLILNVWLPAAF